MNANNDEGKLISGKEALIALANGEDVQYFDTRETFKKLGWSCAKDMQAWLFLKKDNFFKFRLTPRTININGIEVPAPFEPEDGEQFWHLYPSMGRGYNFTVSVDSDHYQQFGAWRTEEEIKQVVAALRQVFGGAV